MFTWTLKYWCQLKKSSRVCVTYNWSCAHVHKCFYGLCADISKPVRSEQIFLHQTLRDLWSLLEQLHLMNNRE